MKIVGSENEVHCDIDGCDGSCQESSTDCQSNDTSEEDFCLQEPSIVVLGQLCTQAGSLQRIKPTC